ncbi:MAG: hypothetical protein H5T74_04285 [Actinobacteria bacterium]|nr:hypothetical protein [Actinomycetota bacterium]
MSLEMGLDPSLSPGARAAGQVRAGGATATPGGEELRGLCEEFEAVFIREILRAARVFEEAGGSEYGMSALDPCTELARALAGKLYLWGQPRTWDILHKI